MPKMQHLCNTFEVYSDTSDHPVSQLTCSGSAGSKKRAYMALSHNLPVDSRLFDSPEASISGRPTATGVSVPDTLMMPSLNHSIEIETFLRLQTAQLQSGIEQLRRKHSRDILSLAEVQASKRMKVKEMELERVSMRNRELEEQVRQMAAESQAWFNYAKTTEAVVSGLKAKLDTVISSQNACPQLDVEEGYGESSGIYDTESSSGIDEGRRSCKVCREMEVCVLLLPCRHLCLCKDCEARIETCPVCNSARNASIQVVI